jgi:hypothetical protein
MTLKIINNANVLAADTIAFTEGGAEAMRIDSSGRVGIATTNPTSNLTVASAGGAGVFNIRTNANSLVNPNTTGAEIVGSQITLGTNIILSERQPIGAFTDNTNLVFRTDSGGGSGQSDKMTLSSGGALILVGSTAQKATGTTWSNPSDTRLKDNKQNYTKGLNELLQINVKTWEWNGKAGTTQGTTGIGIIADEIETILPNTVDTYKVILNKGDTEETKVKRFDATEITWLLLNSIKELSAKNDALEATSISQQTKIDALETRLTALESN